MKVSPMACLFLHQMLILSYILFKSTHTHHVFLYSITLTSSLQIFECSETLENRSLALLFFEIYTQLWILHRERRVFLFLKKVLRYPGKLIWGCSYQLGEWQKMCGLGFWKARAEFESHGVVI